MLKSQEGRFFIGVALFSLTLCLGLYLRLTQISEASAWSLEVSNFYFAKHLDRVFFHDTLSPLYYALSNLWMKGLSPDVISLRYLSISLSSIIVISSSLILWRMKGMEIGLTFFTLFWLLPSDVLLSREGSVLSFFGEMTLLIVVLWHFRQRISSWILWPLCLVYQMIHPLALVVLWFLLAVSYFKKKSPASELRLFFTSGFVALIYYGIRFIFFGKDFVAGLYSNTGPLPPWIPGALVYYLSFGFLICVFYFLQRSQLWVTSALLLVLASFHFQYLRPWKSTPWDDQNVAEFKNQLPKLAPKQLVVCASAAQMEYYFGFEYQACSTEILRLHLLRQGFYLFSLSGDDDLVMKFLKESGRVEGTQSFNHARMLSVRYSPRK